LDVEVKKRTSEYWKKWRNWTTVISGLIAVIAIFGFEVKDVFKLKDQLKNAEEKIKEIDTSSPQPGLSQRASRKAPAMRAPRRRPPPILDAKVKDANEASKSARDAKADAEMARRESQAYKQAVDRCDSRSPGPPKQMTSSSFVSSPPWPIAARF
jgi:hypothetical protein